MPETMTTDSLFPFIVYCLCTYGSLVFHPSH